MNSANTKPMNGSNSSANSSMNSSANSSMNSTETMSGGRRKGMRRNQMGGQNNKLSMASQMGGKKTRKNNMMGGKKTRKNNMMGGKKMMYGGARRAVGSHAEVWHGTADHTSGGLKKSDLMKNKHGRIISKRKHALGKKALKNLVKAGFKAKKGTFKLFRK